MGGDTGICDFCEGYGCPSCQQQDDSTSIDVSIANAFYEAESWPFCSFLSPSASSSALRSSHMLRNICKPQFEYLSKGDMKSDPEKSLELFQKVLELAAGAEEELQSDSKDT